MLYQLPDGRTIEMSISDYLDFTDEELQSLIGYDFGLVINNPHYGSAMTNKKRRSKKDIEDVLPSEKEVNDVTPQEKIQDQDYSADDE